MGTAGRHAQVAFALVMALGSAAVASAAAPSGATGRVERLPITGMLKVTQADGSVLYLSTDRRFAFRGEMTDLWTGTDLSVGELENRVDLDRNGVSVEKISLAIGRGKQPLTVFVAPECEQCRTVVEMLSGTRGAEGVPVAGRAPRQLAGRCPGQCGDLVRHGSCRGLAVGLPRGPSAQECGPRRRVV